MQKVNTAESCAVQIILKSLGASTNMKNTAKGVIKISDYFETDIKKQKRNRAEAFL